MATWVGLLDALGERQAVIAGHDCGAPVAWHAALLRPDRFRAVIGLSVPYLPRSKARPTTLMPQNEGERFYQLYFQEPGLAKAELQRDVRKTIRCLLYGASGDRGEPGDLPGLSMVGRHEGLLDRMSDQGRLQSWLSERDIDYYTAEFERTGSTGTATST